MSNRWTVRSVDPEALDLLREVQEHSGLPMGELLSEAIQVWYQGLPEADTSGDKQIDTLDPRVPNCPSSLDDLLRQFSSRG